MVDRRGFEFVVLVYGGGLGGERALPVAVVAYELGSDPAGKLILHVAATLDIENKRHLGYLAELFESWGETPVEEIGRLFGEIQGLSSGVLWARDSGFCSIDELPGIVDGTLGRFLRTELAARTIPDGGTD